MINKRVFAPLTLTLRSFSSRFRSFAVLVVMMVFVSPAMPQTPVSMSILQRLNVIGTDRMTTTDPSVETCAPEDCPSEGQVFYVPDSPGPRRVTLFRFYNGRDHLDSTHFRVPGYWSEGPLGQPFKIGTLPGLRPLVEGFNWETGDNALISPFEHLAGYTRVPSLIHAFGYPRFLNQTESLLSLRAGGVEIASNRVYGGALWNWTWKGKQFFSHLDSLRGSYSILFINGWTDFINENVDDCGNHAPIVTAVNMGTTQSTTSVPLAMAFSHGSDQPCLHPVVWQDVSVGKTITLNFAGMGPVAKYTTTLSSPNALGADFFHPISSLNAEFNRYWTYDAETADLEEVTIADACEDSHQFYPNFGGIVLSDQSTTFAMGIYGVNVSQGGSVSQLNLLRHVCDDGTYSRMDVIRSGDIAAGHSSYNAYIMTGTVDQVRQYMGRLYRMGVR